MFGVQSNFEWFVIEGGYEFVDATEKGKRIRRLAPIDGFGFSRMITPLAKRELLYRDFADLEKTEDAIVAFANQWGPLAVAHPVVTNDNSEDEIDFGWNSEKDYLDNWQTQITTMKALTELWDAIAHPDRTNLSELIECQFERGEQYVTVTLELRDQPQTEIKIDNRTMPVLSQIRGEDVTKELARYCLCEWTNRQLWTSCSPQIVVNHATAKAELILVPHDLQSALWLQFAGDVIGERELRQCPYCKRYFDFLEKGNKTRGRSDKTWCSDNCRSAGYRQRKERAVALYEAGKRVEQIATELGVDKSSVRNWLPKKRSRRRQSSDRKS